MSLIGSDQLADRRLCSRRGYIIALAVVALTVSLATRTVYVDVNLKTTLHSDCSYNKVQHRDKDSFEWAPPATNLCLLFLTEFSVSYESSPTLQFRLQHESLYNRPPPIAA
jgi:hypothetical protein